ncbi:ACP S-malonyltransferase [Micromonospora sp. CPCC 205561]|uniref:ACP S-malonyltransferase n=1 Tax=Micromonospora sp. CPCC 205561 TaxID=3122407 RepID=UPI002FF3FB94
MLAHRFAALFPGQGSQIPAMAARLATADARLPTPYLDTADELLGMPLSRLCLRGSAEELRDTAVAQPAILLTSLIALELLRERGLEPAVAVGHSLGEFAALVAAGVLEWTDALRLVHRRGQLMAEVGRAAPGGMAAVLGIEAARVEEICARVGRDGGGTVEVANYNAERQTVVSGTAAGIAAASAAARELGADVVALKVSAPFHSSLMRDVEQEFTSALDEVAFGTPRIPVVSTVTARPLLDGPAAAVALRRQLCAPVRWHEVVRALAEQEIAAFVEVGPGRVLANLGGAIAPGVPALPAGTTEQLDAAAARLRARQ